jgi:hypothetical protein
MGHVPGPKKVNDTCVKMMQRFHCTCFGSIICHMGNFVSNILFKLPFRLFG